MRICLAEFQQYGQSKLHQVVLVGPDASSMDAFGNAMFIIDQRRVGLNAKDHVYEAISQLPRAWSAHVARLRGWFRLSYLA